MEDKSLLDKANDLAGLITETLIEKLEGPDAIASDYNAAIHWLKHNNITVANVPLERTKRLAELALPELPDDTVVPLTSRKG